MIGFYFFLRCCRKRRNEKRMPNFFIQIGDLISAFGRFYLKTMGDSRQDNRRPSSQQNSRISIFSDGQYVAEESRVPIHEANNSRMQHLAVKSEERSDPHVREGRYIDTLIFINSSGDWSYGGKLNSPETVRQECGNVLGDKDCQEAGISRYSLDVREWYRGVKLGIFKHAFASPYEMLGMLMVINSEKEPNYRIRVGQAGKPRSAVYTTLNIVGRYAEEMIESQLAVHEQEEEGKLQKLYADRVAMPSIAYLRREGFGQEFHENALINGLMQETLSKSTYVVPFGTSIETSRNFICQKELCPCRQMMRYVRGFRWVPSEAWQPPKVKLQLNMVEAQRDVLKARREIIKRDDQLYQDRYEELEDVRLQIEIIDMRWARTRWRDEIDLGSRPMVTSLEWRELQTKIDSSLDWEQWGELESNKQCDMMVNANLVFGKPIGWVDEGNNSDDGDRGKEGVRRVASNVTVTPPTLPPSANIIPRRPMEAMPYSSDPTRTGYEDRPQRIPDRPPVSTKPPPTAAPRRSQENLSVQESARRLGENANQSGSSAERDANGGSENSKLVEEGTHTLGFGWNVNVAYDEAWSWIVTNSMSIDKLMQGCSLSNDRVPKFLSWYHLKKEAKRRSE